MKFEEEYPFIYIRHRSWVWKFIETLLITVSVLLLSQVLWPRDPVFLSGPMPWPMLLPIFCCLFYGAAYGSVSLILLLFFLLYKNPDILLTEPTIQLYVGGSIALLVLVSIFSTYWISRIEHVEGLNQYLWEHLEDISKEYYLLHISHDRLEQSYIMKPVSVRDVFHQIDTELCVNKGQLNKKIAETMLGIFSQYCSMNNAAFCLIEEHENQVNTLAFLGKAFPIVLEDPLIQQTLKEKSGFYTAVNQFNENNQSQYLAIVPLLSIKKTVLGFIVIKDMAFWSLNHDNLEVLSVFADYLSLRWTQKDRIKSLLQIFPKCPAMFLSEFQTLIDLKQRYPVEHGLTCIIVPPGVQQSNIVYTLERGKRSLDYQWVYTIEKSIAVITLMPFTGLEGLAGYKKRVNDLLKNDFGVQFNNEGIVFRSRLLNKEETSEQLTQFLQEIRHALAQ
ncbi:hypothetical protein E3983_05170 [Legionella israelensis]|uniref:PelD GGDEF domain-containing protein n=1 Tax=Legionella israelensis TaxID=454 RepID=A0AAX1EFC3_9GAMM|nr:PelD GGDEF domain-containing protein [Legionella israelensis]QBR83794.1 hypothetical protein E3983_05170 [Legionella israelensis]